MHNIRIGALVSALRAFGGEKLVSIKVNNRKLIDHFFKEVLSLSADVALQTTKAIDARGKIGEEGYAKWLSEIGLSEDQRRKMEEFFQAPFEKTAVGI